jgi:glycosyltransferase 2 family protein
MKKHLPKILIIAVLTAVFAYFFARSAKWADVLKYIEGVNLPLLVLLFPFALVHFLTRGLRWRYLLVHEKKDVRYWPMVAANVVGFTVTFVFPGRLGELVKPLYLARREGIRPGFAVGTVVVERVFDMFTMCFFLGLFLLARSLFPGLIDIAPDAYGRLTFWGVVGGAFALVILALVVVLSLFREKAVRVIGRLLRPLSERLRGRILKLVHEFIDGLKLFHSLGNFLMYTLLSFVVWLAIILYYWILMFAFHIHVPYFMVVPYVFLTMIGASIPTPGMAGGYDYFSKYGLTSLLLVPADLAVGMTLVIHAIQVLVTCVVGYVILCREGLSLFQIKKMGESEEL